jgi:hypothetical protein
MERAEPLDKQLYEQAKRVVYRRYRKPSAYRSGALVKYYLEHGGRYKGDKHEGLPLKRWFKEKWDDVGI